MITHPPKREPDYKDTSLHIPRIPDEETAEVVLKLLRRGRIVTVFNCERWPWLNK